MAKHSFEFKKKVVLEYLNGEGGTPYLSTKYGLGSNTQLRKWINAYKKFGDTGLMRSRKNKNYSFEYKLHVVELYLTSEVSYQELALQEGINNPSLISIWVNRFQVAGSDALRPRKKGRKKTLDKTNSENNSQPTKSSQVDTREEHVKELEDELLKLRIENAFLKELRRLRLEDEAKMRDLPESSTASEDDSN
jgi:transposase